MNAWKRWITAVVVAVGATACLGGGLARAQDFGTVSTDALKKMIEGGDPTILIVDVQPKSVYDQGHIKGAVSYPWDQDLKSDGGLPKDKILVLYCDCGNEEDARDTAFQLKDKWGYSKIKLLEGGWSRWKQLGYPVEKK